MATEELAKVTILGLQKDKTKVLDFLQEHALMHVNHFEELNNSENLTRDRSATEADDVISLLLEFEWMSEQLKPFTKRTLHTHFPKRKLADTLKEVHSLKGALYNKLHDLVNQYNENVDSIQMLQQHIQLLKSIPFDLPKGVVIPQEGEYTFTYLFQEPEEPVPVEFDKKLTVLRKDGYILVQGYRSQQVGVEELAKEAGLRALSVPELNKNKSEELDVIKKHLSALKKEDRDLEKQIRTLAHAHFTKIKQLEHELTIFHDRYETAGQFLRTEKTFLAEGYVPVKKMQELKKVNKIAKIHIMTELVDQGPTKLLNNPYVKRYEFITKMFGVPKYGAVDPTLYISVFLPFFFGFMFSDIGYGILLAISSAYLYWKAPKSAPIFQDAGYVLFVCSLTTILFGWFFGSFFGNLIKITPLIFDPFTNAKWVLVSSLSIGLLHLNLGIFTGAYEKIRDGLFKDLVLDYGSLVSMQVGIVLVALGMNIGWVLFGLAIGLFLLKAGLMGLMDVTGFVGTWFSYARLLALSLATGGIALGINIMAWQLNDVGLLGPLLFVLLVVFGHLFNFVLNVLGSTIHSVRLHYIEFFSQFYEGGGKPFSVFTTDRLQESL